MQRQGRLTEPTHNRKTSPAMHPLTSTGPVEFVRITDFSFPPVTYARQTSAVIDHHREKREPRVMLASLIIFDVSYNSTYCSTLKWLGEWLSRSRVYSARNKVGTYREICWNKIRCRYVCSASSPLEISVAATVFFLFALLLQNACEGVVWLAERQKARKTWESYSPNFQSIYKNNMIAL